MTVACLKTLDLIVKDNKTLISAENISQFIKIAYTFSHFQQDNYFENTHVNQRSLFQFGYGAYISSSISSTISEKRNFATKPVSKIDSDSSDFVVNSNAESEMSDSGSGIRSVKHRYNFKGYIFSKKYLVMRV